MKPDVLQHRSPARFARGQQAFTMVEIALALGVIGIALVAIIGVLPQAVDVQKNNRRDTIVNQDASYYIDALRGGGQHLDDLTNYILCITNYWTLYNPDGTRKFSKTTPYDDFDSYTNVDFDHHKTDTGCRVNNPNNQTNHNKKVYEDYRLTNGLRILGVMSTPRYFTFVDGSYQSNNLLVYALSQSGVAAEKSPQTNELARSLAFAYRFAVQIAPHTSLATNWNNSSFTRQFASEFGTNASGIYERQVRENLHTNLCDARLYFRWPLLPNNDIGNGERKFRMEVAGSIVRTNDGEGTNQVDLYYFRPQFHVTLPAAGAAVP